MEELEKIFIEMLDHIDNHKESYNKPQWTNEAIVKTWIKSNEHRLKLLGISDFVENACICDEMRRQKVDNYYCHSCKTDWV